MWGFTPPTVVPFCVSNLMVAPVAARSLAQGAERIRVRASVKPDANPARWLPAPTSNTITHNPLRTDRALPIAAPFPGSYTISLAGGRTSNAPLETYDAHNGRQR